MEPHFIFNTLSTLQSLIRFEDKKQSIKYLNQFSRLLRNSLDMSRQDWVVLEEEIETLVSYINLQQMRFEDLFDYKINIAEDVDDTAMMIPPMLIQPFVENSILHGFKSETKAKTWLLEIKIQKLDESLLQIIIQDNGKGFDKTDSNVSNKSFSGTIAKERLEILAKKNKSKAQYKIETSKDNGTIVRLQLPFKR